MLRTWRGLLAAGVAVAAGLSAVATAAAEPSPLTTREAETLSSPDLARRVLDSLAGTMVEVRRPGSAFYLEMRGTPRSSGNFGICEVDVVSASFRPVAAASHEADPPSVVSDLTYEHRFAVAGDVDPQSVTWNDAYKAELNARCAHIKGWNFFEAPSGEVASRAVRNAQTVQRAALQKRLPFAFACKPGPGDCDGPKDLSTLRPEQLVSVEEQTCVAGDERMLCQTLTFETDRELNLHELTKVDIAYSDSGYIVGRSPDQQDRLTVRRVGLRLVTMIVD